MRSSTYREITIESIDSPSIDRLADLVTEADAIGFNALSRLMSEWQSGRNRFDRSGEALLIAHAGGRAVGVCGLNLDPYLGDPTVGRVRHLCVARDHRRKGIGTRLVRTVIGLAERHFVRLRLRTDSPDADAFYRAIGFVPLTSEPACSHHFPLTTH